MREYFIRKDEIQSIWKHGGEIVTNRMTLHWSFFNVPFALFLIHCISILTPSPFFMLCSSKRIFQSVNKDFFISDMMWRILHNVKWISSFFFAHEIFAYMKGMLKVSASAILSSFFLCAEWGKLFNCVPRPPPGRKSKR